MENIFCVDCKKVTNHNNGKCLKCAQRFKNEQDAVKRTEFESKTTDQKLN